MNAPSRRAAAALAVAAAAVAIGSGTVVASNAVSGLGGSRGDLSVPTWLYLATGGGVIGASALLSMLVTDRAVIADFHERRPGRSLAALRRAGGYLLGAIGVLGLVAVVVVGFVGPQTGTVSLAVLLAFVGVRAGLTATAYLVGNPWPAIDPWRRIASALPSGFREYPDSLGSWPAVAGLLGLVWLEVVAPLSSSPRALAVATLGYSAYTVAGAVVFSPEAWFRRADPISVAFRLYGAVAPIGRTEDGLELRYPGSRLGDGDLVVDRSVVGFAVALVWELTYNGFVVTPQGAAVVEAVVGVGVPPALVYLALLVAGYALFLGAYRVAAGRSRERARTYVSRRHLGLRFAPPLVAIAAGYHVAHYLGFAISLSPSLLDALASPLSPPVNPTRLALPDWFGAVEIGAILLGHVLGIWVAHAVSFELFPGKLQAIRSQYPFVLVMIAFTMLSLWLVSLPTVGAPYVPG